MDEEESSVAGSGIPVYETAGMLSEMFNFPGGGRGDLQHGQSFQSNRQLLEQQHQNIPAMNHVTDSAAAMQLFLMNPPPQQQPPSPSSTTRSHHNSSTLHMLLPNPPTHSTHHQSYNMSMHQLPHQHLTWQSSSSSDHREIRTVQSGQGLSLSLSSSLEAAAAKAEEYRNIYYGSNQFKIDLLANSSNHHHHQVLDQFRSSSSSVGAINILRNSRYTKPAQELLEEFCSVGRGFFKNNKFGNTSKPNTSGGDGSGGGSPSSAGAIKDHPPLSASDRIEHQRRKVKLLTMLEEVDRRYNHYCQQMQMVMNSFDIVMGHGSALPYTALAKNAMSRHFRCLKDAVTAQLKQGYEFLGDKDAAGISSSSSGLTKGETPRLRLLEQSLRQQRAFHQMGMMEQEAWRPQRGLPERSVNILRAWLFEHFLHPYPSDADKHLLARQTGLSRNQVDRRYNHYCQQMQMVMNSFDIVMGHGSALPYTALAKNAMSRHFRCLKDAVTAQLKQGYEFLGDKDAAGISSSSGLTKGETPRLRLLEQSLRQQRAFHQMGMMEQEAWRPQRGLPERSVNILRAWLFEHFLHPYPSDADKHLLARQTGLSRNQVSNWFINARVRLWKPMVEDMYQQESKERESAKEEDEEFEEDEETKSINNDKSTKSNNNESYFTTVRTTSQTPITTAQSAATVSDVAVTTCHRVRSDINAYESDPSSLLLPYSNAAVVSDDLGSRYGGSATFSPVTTCQQGVGGFDDADMDGVNVIRFGTTNPTAGDVSLTLGLRHAGNMTDKNASFLL